MIRQISGIHILLALSVWAQASEAQPLQGQVDENQKQETKSTGHYGLKRDDLDPFAGAHGKTTTGTAKDLDDFGGQSMAKPVLKGEADLDNTKAMQIAWDSWHKHVAGVVYQRFQFAAARSFADSPPLIAKISYVVTRAGHVQNLKVLEPSIDNEFDKLVTRVVSSLDGDISLLKFPSGSRREAVEKVATFTQNLDEEGYRPATGDQERLSKGKQ
jgi:hypothetical protein